MKREENFFWWSEFFYFEWAQKRTFFEKNKFTLLYRDGMIWDIIKWCIRLNANNNFTKFIFIITQTIHGAG